MSGQATESRGRGISAALDALAETLVLVDVSDRSTLNDLLSAIRRVARVTRRGPGGEVVRAAMTSAESAVQDAMGGLTDPQTMLLAVVGCFETARSALTHTPTLERSRAGAEAKPEEPGQDSERSPLAEDAELIADFVTRATEHLDGADTLLLTLEQSPDDRDALDATFRVFHTIKGMAGFLGFSEIERLAHDTESFLDGPRKGIEQFSTQAFDAVFAAVDRMRDLVGFRTPVSAPTSLCHPQAGTRPAAPGGTTAPAQAGVRSPGGAGSIARESSGRRAADSIVRVDEDRLDLLLDTIGELVIAEAMVSESARNSASTWGLLGEKLSRLDKITRELQEMATSLRMVPLKGTFGRMARLVRDLGQKAGKSVEFVTEGEDTELDKALVDLMYDPLVHLVRNAVDHGLESADARVAAGKPRTGKVRLRAFHAGGSVCVEVEDDGAGLDLDRILQKARSQGLVAEDASPSRREIHDLIFVPGFSTVTTVTDVSGRGVGMDVVRRTVEGLRGTIEVYSTLGSGTRFTLRLPLTLAIIDGMVLRVGSERYILPTLVIQRSLRPDPSDVSTVLHKGEALAVDDSLVPLVRLARLFEVSDADPHPSEGIVVLVGENGERAGLVASELLGQQQTVIKPLGDAASNTPGISGGAIMPDGTVGLILDVSGLVRLAHAEGGE
ncbi:MAG: chemotaxis protein CheA [Actinobacteria bacterium]|nr:chemotaxis protein CheA [Actinomycetota bacterium]